MSADGRTAITRRDPAVSAWAGRLRSVAGRIDGAFLPLEPVFLSTGERLRELHGQVSRLSSAAESASALLSSSEMDGMLTGLAEAAGHIEVMRHQRGGLHDALRQMIAGTDTMLGSLTALSRIMSQVLVLAVNAKIEASQLVATGTDFTVFTREIARLAHGGEQTIAAVRQELTSLKTAAALARDLQKTFQEKELPELDAVAERLAAAIRGLRDSRNRAAHGAHEIPGRLRALFGHITTLVSHMQVYDATRQRLEHVGQALTQAATAIEAEHDSGMTDAQRRVFVNGMAELQSLQLTHASDHYHEAVSEVGRSLAAMAEGAPAVGDLCQRSFGGGDEGSLRDIDRNLMKTGEIFLSFTAIRAKAAGSLDLVTRAATRAGELMRSLNSVNGDMRLMGLNAAIKCGNMGSMGRALSVIAQELQSYAGLTREHVEQVAAHLGEITRAARDIAVADDGQTGHIDADAVKRGLDTEVSRLHETGERLSGLLLEIATLSASVAPLAEATNRGFAGKADCRPALTEGGRELKTLAADSDPGLRGAELEAARREVLAFTESHYTMASERSVHGAVVDHRTATGAAPPAAGAGAGADISGLLF